MGSAEKVGPIFCFTGNFYQLPTNDLYQTPWISNIKNDSVTRLSAFSLAGPSLPPWSFYE